MPKDSPYQQLLAQQSEVNHLEFFMRLASWDRECTMPAAANSSRTERIVYLSKAIHERYCSPAYNDALLAAEAESETLDEIEQRNLQLMRRHFDKTTKLPAEWVSKWAQQRGINSSSWKQARADDNFSIFEKDLEKTIELQREKAEIYGYQQHIYDPLHEHFEIGSNYADIKSLFGNLAPACSSLLQEVRDKQQSKTIPEGPYDIEAEKRLVEGILASMGFDRERSCIGETVHPFCSRIDHHDTRLAIRYDKENPLLFISMLMHEAGHGLYNLGLPGKYAGQQVGEAVSLGIHESQSRLWENYVGRSRPYCEWLLTHIQTELKEFKSVSLDDFYRMRNSVHNCRIRVESDEISYNLHIILRFEMECALLNGDLSVAELPQTWNVRFEELLGYPVRNDAEGCLQDVHWSMGAFGYFPTYSMGNCYAAQFYHYAKRDVKDLEDHYKQADCTALLKWLGKNIHKHGSRYLPGDLCVRVTGETLNPIYLLNSLRQRYLAD